MPAPGSQQQPHPQNFEIKPFYHALAVRVFAPSFEAPWHTQLTAKSLLREFNDGPISGAKIQES